MGAAGASTAARTNPAQPDTTLAARHGPSLTPPLYRYIWRFDLNPRLREYLFAGEAPGAGAGAAGGAGVAGEDAQMAEAKEGKGDNFQFHRPDSHPPLTAEQIAAAAAAWRAARPAAGYK
jgi:hypothetical protein